MPSDPSVSLEQYALLRRLLRSGNPTEIEAILRKHGMTPEAWDQAKAHWTLALERDASEGDGELLLEWAKACELAEAAPDPVATTAKRPTPLPPAPAPPPPPPDSSPKAAAALPSFMLPQQQKVAV